jgi:hypothetical protein
MRITKFVFVVFALAFFLAPAIAVSSAQEAWGETVSEGIEFLEYNLTGPKNNVFVARMDRNNSNVILESSIAQGRISGGTETVSGMAGRYDGALNYWGGAWGNRNQVAVAINGFYYDWFSGVPQQGQVHSGWYSKLFDSCQSGTVSGSGLAWNLDRGLFIGESVTNPKKEIVYFRDGDDPLQPYDGINIPRSPNKFILYTPQFDQTTKTESGPESIEVLVRMDSPSLINPNINLVPTGTVVKIYDNKGSTPIPFDHVVLSLHGSRKTEFLGLGVIVGDNIGIHQKIDKCGVSPAYDWTNTYAGVGGAYYFLKDGAIQNFTDDGAKFRHPRTAIAFNNDYVYFIVVDGRDEVNSLGMTIAELANFAKVELGATHGVAQDGGGSSTMVVDGAVVNNTICNILVCTGNIYLPLISRPGGGAQNGPAIPLPTPSPLDQPEELSGDGLPLSNEFYALGPDATGAKLQRLVANGMMMVVVQPKVVSEKFTPNQSIKTSLTADVRLGPGTNYAVLASVSADTPGVITGEDNGLNGVSAKGAYWWRVLLEPSGGIDVTGWVNESYLTGNP